MASGSVLIALAFALAGGGADSASSAPSSVPRGYVDDSFRIDLHRHGCELALGHSIPLFFELKRPWRRNLLALVKKLKPRLGQVEPTCFRGGQVHVYVSREQAEAWLGDRAQFRCAQGAGNRVDADAYFVIIKPTRFVPAALRAHVRRMWFNDDPKFEAVDWPEEVDCATFRPADDG